MRETQGEKTRVNGSSPPPEFYKDQVHKTFAAAGRPLPWDLGKAQPHIARAADAISGVVLDVGSGTGDNSIWLAGLSGVSRVIGVDLSEDSV